MTKLEALEKEFNERLETVKQYKACLEHAIKDLNAMIPALNKELAPADIKVHPLLTQVYVGERYHSVT